MSTQDNWLNQISREPLPVLGSSKAAVLQLLAAPDPVVSEVAREIARDPAMTQHVVLGAWERQQQSKRQRDIRTLEQAINMLGLQATEKRLATQPVLSNDHLKLEPVQRYLSALMQSQYAAELARQWAVVQLHRNVDEVWLAALLFNQVTWFLALRGQRFLSQCADALAADKPVLDTEKQVFNATLIDVTRQFTDSHCPLDNLYQALLPGSLPDARSLIRIRKGDIDLIRKWATKPPVWVYYANHLAGYFLMHGANAHLEKRLLILGGMLRHSEVATWQSFREAAIEVSRNTRLPAVTPAARLMTDSLPVRDISLTLPVWVALPARSLPAKAPAPPLEQTQALVPAQPAAPTMAEPPHRRFLALLADDSTPFKDLHELLNFLAIGLCRTLFFNRVEILLFTPDRTQLMSHYHAGLSADSPLRRLRITIGNNALLRQMMQAPVVLHINSLNAGKYWPHVPETIRLTEPKPELILGSVFLGERPIALVIADREGKPIADKQRDNAAQMIKQASACLRRLAQSRQPVRQQTAKA